MDPILHVVRVIESLVALCRPSYDLVPIWPTDMFSSSRVLDLVDPAIPDPDDLVRNIEHS